MEALTLLHTKEIANSVLKEIKSYTNQITNMANKQTPHFAPKSKDKVIAETAVRLLQEVVDSNSLNPFDDTVKAKVCKFLFKTTRLNKYNRFG